MPTRIDNTIRAEHLQPILAEDMLMPIYRHWGLRFGPDLYVKKELIAHYNGKTIVVFPPAPSVRMLNLFIDYWDFSGRILRDIRMTPSRLKYTERGLFPPHDYYPGIEFDRLGRIVNGAPKEAARRNELLDLLDIWRARLQRQGFIPRPTPQDCPFCRGREPAKDRATIYDDWNHVYRHLKSNWLEGTMIVNALEEMGFGREGTSMVCGWAPGFGLNLAAIITALEAHVRYRAGMTLYEGRTL
jgi:hypothetical protein